MEDEKQRRDRAEKTLNSRWERLGFDALLPPEQHYIALWWLSGEVSNGSFHQYFYNSAGDLAPLAIEGLKAVDATDSLRILERALALFPPGGYSTDRETRWKGLEAIPVDENGSADAFDELSSAILNNSEDFEGRTLDRLAELYSTIEV